MRTFRLLLASVRDFGVLGTLDQLPLALLSPLTTWQLRRRKLRQLSQDGFDAEHGTDTAQILLGGELGPAVSPGGHVVSHYETTSSAAIRMPLDSLGIDCSEFVFIDLGCGKGKPLMVAASYPFRRLIGVDISLRCIAIAQENISRFGPERIDSSRIELLAMDVEDFAFPDSPLVIYLFNSFPAKLLQRVVSNLESSLRRAPREVVIVYVNPAAIAAIRQSPLFVRKRMGADRMLMVTTGTPSYERAAVFVTRPTVFAASLPAEAPRHSQWPTPGPPRGDASSGVDAGSANA